MATACDGEISAALDVFFLERDSRAKDLGAGRLVEITVGETISGPGRAAGLGDGCRESDFSSNRCYSETHFNLFERHRLLSNESRI